MKNVTIGSKPTAKFAPSSPDKWVSDRLSTGEPTKRLTIDIPLSLHQRVKSQCALQGENMADVVRKLLDQHFGPEQRVEVKANEAIPEMQKHDSGTFSKYDSDTPER